MKTKKTSFEKKYEKDLKSVKWLDKNAFIPINKNRLYIKVKTNKNTVKYPFEPALSKSKTAIYQII